ncbi:MAG: lipoate--protein ligase [Synergistaceae bacterium]
MIERLFYVLAKGTNPYENLALEEVVLKNLPQKSCVLYLWQNAKTVVIGKNQNPWLECKSAELTNDGGFLARRISGGGAVFQDMGNLNFTFLTSQKDYDVDKQLSVISEAIKTFGITVEKSGRNDLLIDSKKFSGNAFCKYGSNAYHHGTIMVNIDLSMLSKYLNVSLKKLQSNSVKSVKSRVTNLKEFIPEITVDMMKESLLGAFSQVYGLKLEELPSSVTPHEQLVKTTEKYASWEWIFGRKLKCDVEVENRFTWGGIQMQFCIAGGIIEECSVYSDAMNCDFITSIPELLKGCKFNGISIANALTKKDLSHLNNKVFDRFDNATFEQSSMIKDLSNWIATHESIGFR